MQISSRSGKDESSFTRHIIRYPKQVGVFHGTGDLVSAAPSYRKHLDLQLTRLSVITKLQFASLLCGWLALESSPVDTSSVVVVNNIALCPFRIWKYFMFLKILSVVRDGHTGMRTMSYCPARCVGSHHSRRAVR